MDTLAWLAVGAVLAVAFVRIARRQSPHRERRAFAVGLAVAALVYVVAAAWALNLNGLLLEVIGFGVYGVVALAGGARWPLLLAAGWALHVVWDVVFHLTIQQSYIGLWYPTLCITFDLVVAAYVGWRIHRAAAQPQAT